MSPIGMYLTTALPLGMYLTAVGLYTYSSFLKNYWAISLNWGIKSKNAIYKHCPEKLDLSDYEKINERAL